MQKTTPKTPNIRKMTHLRAVAKFPILQSLKPFKMLNLGQKLNMPTTCEKRFYN